MMRTKSPLLTQEGEGEEHKTPKVEGVVELQGVEELVKNKVEEEKIQNGLENFVIDEEQTPELFNSDENNSNEEFSSLDSEEHDSEDSDLEIPAFLRRQNN